MGYIADNWKQILGCSTHDLAQPLYCIGKCPGSLLEHAIAEPISVTFVTVCLNVSILRLIINFLFSHWHFWET